MKFWQIIYQKTTQSFINFSVSNTSPIKISGQCNTDDNVIDFLRERKKIILLKNFMKFLFNFSIKNVHIFRKTYFFTHLWNYVMHEEMIGINQNANILENMAPNTIITLDGANSHIRNSSMWHAVFINHQTNEIVTGSEVTKARKSGDFFVHINI